MTLEERKNIALKLRQEGYNCAQSVIMAFSDITDLSADDASKLSIGFGGGFGGQGQICGVVSAMTMVAGYTSTGKPEDKTSAYSNICQLCNTFANDNGSLLCHTLKNENKKSCNELILNGIETIHNNLTKP